MKCIYCHIDNPEVWRSACTNCADVIACCVDCLDKLRETKRHVFCDFCAVNYWSIGILQDMFVQLRDASVPGIYSVMEARRDIHVAANAQNSLSDCDCEYCLTVKENESYKAADVILEGLARVLVEDEDSEELVYKVIEQLRSTGGDFVDADLRVTKKIEMITNANSDHDPAKVRRIKSKNK